MRKFLLASLFLFCSSFDHYSDKEADGVIKITVEKNNLEDLWFGFSPYECWKSGGGSDYVEFRYQKIGEEKIEVDVDAFRKFLGDITNRLDNFPLHEHFKDWFLRYVFCNGEGEKIAKKIYMNWGIELSDEQLKKYAENFVLANMSDEYETTSLFDILRFNLSDIGCDVAINGKKVKLDFFYYPTDIFLNGNFSVLLGRIRFDKNGVCDKNGNYGLGSKNKSVNVYIKNRKNKNFKDELLISTNEERSLLKYLLKKGEDGKYKYINNNEKGDFNKDYYIDIEIGKDAEFKRIENLENKKKENDKKGGWKVGEKKSVGKGNINNKNINNINVGGGNENECCSCCGCCPCCKR